MIFLAAVPALAGAAYAWFKSATLAYGAYRLYEEAAPLIQQYVNSDGFEQIVLEKINEKIASTGYDIVLTSLTDVATIKNDIDQGIANALNQKIGTTLMGIRSLSKDQILTSVGEVVAQKINTATGTTLTTIYPIDTFREQIGVQIANQLDPDFVGAGSLLNMTGKTQVRDAVMRSISLYVPQAPSTPTLTTSVYELARNRAKQKKYRMTHKAVYVPRTSAGNPPPPVTPPAPNMAHYNNGWQYGYADGFAAAAQLTQAQLTNRKKSDSWKIGYTQGYAHGSAAR